MRLQLQCLRDESTHILMISSWAMQFFHVSECPYAASCAVCQK